MQARSLVVEIVLLDRQLFVLCESHGQLDRLISCDLCDFLGCSNLFIDAHKIIQGTEDYDGSADCGFCCPKCGNYSEVDCSPLEGAPDNDGIPKYPILSEVNNFARCNQPG